MQKIHIENFMAITLADIEIKKMVLLIGEQASGKSTIAKLVYFFKSIQDDYFNFISENIDKITTADDIGSEFFPTIRKKFLRFFGAIQHLPPSFKITYEYADKKYITLSQGSHQEGKKYLKIYFPHDFQTKIKDEVIPLIGRIKEILRDRDNKYTSSTYRAALEELNLYTEKLFENKMRLVFIPAGRLITVTYPDYFRVNFSNSLSSDLALIRDEDDVRPRFVQDTYLMLQFLKRVQTLTDAFKGLTFEALIDEIPDKQKERISKAKLALTKIEQILKGKYKSDGVFGERISFNDIGGYVQLSNSSSGQQEVIRILQDIFLILVNGESAFRVIEEPEAHLFPTAQKRLLETMALMLNATESQIFLTTHSPYVLSVLTNLLFASDLSDKGLNKNEHIPAEYQLKSAEMAVYSLSNGESRSILNKETGLIDQNDLDDISGELAGEFDFMYTKLIEMGK